MVILGRAAAGLLTLTKGHGISLGDGLGHCYEPGYGDTGITDQNRVVRKIPDALLR